MEGRTFGDFTVKERLGEGGGGVVYRAEQVTLGREVVVKIIQRGDDDVAARFLREARLASQLDHPFAAHVYGFGTEADGALWIAMELVRGTALDSILKEQGPLPLARFVPFFERLCEVLHAAHEQGIVHRDVKPANVMVIQRSGRLLPKLLDLGIARRGFDALDLAQPDEAGSAPVLNEPVLTDPGALSTILATRLAESETLNLTLQGSVVGTPHFMSPEQWADASRVDARADIYSLTVLAYQALTGQLPFEGKSIRQLAKAHAAGVLPQLPDNLPSELHPVFVKGAAKQPSQRFSTAIELAAAVRAASGLGTEPLVLPQLDEALRENFLSEAPQPLAESVALLEAARTPKQQLEAIAMVRRVSIRHLGILALAWRARIGPGAPHDEPAAAALIRRLATDRLSDGEWLTLTSSLCRPFVFRKAAHPLPELITFFFAGETGAELGAGSRALAALDALPWPPSEAPDEAVHAALLKLVPALGAVLKAFSFLFDYALVVRRGEAEQWMGTRRVRRLARSIATGPQDSVGQPVLVDSVGLEVISLAPLLQVLPPGAGLPDELFYLDGAGRHGAKLVALPGPFERQSAEIWPWFSKHILDVAPQLGAAATGDKPPFKGLSTFTTDDADNYFGREKEAESFANRLRLSPLLAVVGPSGSGKSSFILAGVLPLLPHGWRAVVTRPGSDPFQTLVAKLGVNQLTPAAVTASLGAGESLLIVVDQFEELVTLCQDLAARQAFADALVALAEDPSGRVRVVLTCRDDFLIKVQQLRALRDRLSSALQLLGTPAREELLRVVIEPAAKLGYGFDDPTLPGRMVDEVAEYPGALALISFTASQLWELRDRHLHQMRAKTYEALGGVGGALAHHAEATLAKMSPDEAKLVREAFRHLVTSQATRAVLSRKDTLEVLGDSAAARAVLEKLVVARLLVTSEDASGDDRVEIIHEALIVSWPRLVGWLREDAETARLRDALRASAKQWADRAKTPSLLWRKETLAEYRVWRSRFPGRLTQLEEEFAAASLRDESRARALRRGLVALALLTLSVGLVVVFRAYREADASAVIAAQRFADMRVEQGRLAALEDKPYQTLLFTTEARALGASGPTLDYLDQRARTRLEGQVAWQNIGEAGTLVVSPEGSHLAVLGVAGRFRILALPGLKTLFELPSGGTSDLGFAFLSGGSAGLLCRDHEVLLVSGDGRPAAVLAKTVRGIRGCALSPAEDTLATIEPGGRLSLWPVKPGPTLDTPAVIEFDTDVPLLKFSPTGEALIAFHGPRAVMKSGVVFAPLVDVKTGHLIARLETGNDKAQAADFSPDGSRVAIGCLDGIARILETRTGRAITKLTGHADRITDIHFAADGEQLLTAGNDGTVRLWNANGLVKTTLSHGKPVTRVADLGQGQLLTATSDGAVHQWTVGLTAPTISYFGHSSILIGFTLLSPTRFLTTAADGMLRLWDTSSSVAVRRFEVGDNTYVYAPRDEQWAMTGPDLSAFARWKLPSGELLDRMKVTNCQTNPTMAITRGPLLLVASSDESTVCLMPWAPTTTANRLSGHTGTIRKLTFSPDDRLLASSSADSTVIVWQADTGGLLVTLKHPSPPYGIGFSSDGSKLVSACDDGSIHVWDWARKQELLSWVGHGNQGLSAIFEDHDRLVLTGSRDQQVALWSAETGSLIRRFSGHTQSVGAAHVSPDGLLMASIDHAGALIVWDLQTGWAIDRILTGGGPGDVQWLSGGRLITALGSRPSVFLYSPRSSEVLRDWRCLDALALSGNVVVPRQHIDDCVEWDKGGSR